MGEPLLRLEPTRVAAFPRLPCGVRTILRLCDGTRSLSTLIAVSPLSADYTRRVVARLIGLRLVAQQPAAPPRSRRLTPEALEWARARPEAADGSFTPEEEAFFASGIDHLVVDHYER
jgi:hypothetical protein